MKTILSLISRVVYAIGAFALIVMTLIILVDIVLRSLFGSTLGFVEEIVGYLVVAVTIFGVSITIREGALFRVEFLYDNLPASVKHVLHVIYCLIGVVFSSTMLWYTSLLVISTFSRGRVAATELQTPLYLPQALLPIGFLFFLIFVFEKILDKPDADHQASHAIEQAGE